MKSISRILATVAAILLLVVTVTSCQLISFKKTEASITFSGFEEVEDRNFGTIYFRSVSHITEIIDFTKVVSVSEGSTYTVCTDISGKNAIASKVAALANGENTFYVLFTPPKGEVELYVLKIYRSRLYSVSFNSNGGTACQSQIVPENSTASAPETPTREFYTFEGWYLGDEKYDFSTPVTSDITLRAQWKYEVANLVDYGWEKTEILFQLTENTNNDELSSGCARYYSGRDGKGEQLDDYVSDRNSDAYAKANVTVKYSYLPNDTDHQWGDNTNNIFKQATAGGKSNPDMFCNFAYDMTCAALKGAFANLYSNNESFYDSNKNGRQENYLRFTKADYNPDLSENFFDSKAGEGYFKAYMDSLSLSEGKAYCLASDYCTDLLRAFLVIPVNVKLLSGVKIDASKGIVDIKNDGVYDTYDFYEMVWEHKWTYDMLAAISAGVWSNIDGSNDVGGSTTHLGDRIGFAVGVGSGLAGAGLLYTTDVKIIDRAALASGGAYLYPDQNPTLNNIANALNKLFSDGQKHGVCIVTADEAKNKGYTSTVGPELIAIREEFAKNRILFGGVVTVGSLEDIAYKKMSPDEEGEIGGFGIVPVPSYRAFTDAEKVSGNTYRTLVHNLARIVGISVVTDEFEMCTAFLDEVSTNSAYVLDEYYNVNLAAVVGGGAAGERNIDMLVYIRNHVNDCFDKTFEDIVSFYKQTEDAQTWHKILDSNGYKIDNMSGVYGDNAKSKNSVLKEIVAYWNSLHN